MMYSNILDKKIDFIGKFERLQDDFDIICDMMSIKRMKLPFSTTSSSGRFNTTKLLRTPISVRKRIYKLYKYDFGIYGYDKNSLQTNS